MSALKNYIDLHGGKNKFKFWMLARVNGVGGDRYEWLRGRLNSQSEYNNDFEYKVGLNLQRNSYQRRHDIPNFCNIDMYEETFTEMLDTGRIVPCEEWKDYKVVEHTGMEMLTDTVPVVHKWTTLEKVNKRSK